MARTAGRKARHREHVGLHRGEHGTLEAVKFPREGAGLLSSLVDTDGVVELGEDVPRVEPGTIVSCLPYASLL
jgi:molybdopterin molybdotransferase